MREWDAVAALMGALGASLGGMVANLSAGKLGRDDKLRYFSDWSVKAQQVKNAVIVPVGAKGGFVPKRLPTGNRDAIQSEGVAAYRSGEALKVVFTP